MDNNFTRDQKIMISKYVSTMLIENEVFRKNQIHMVFNMVFDNLDDKKTIIRMCERYDNIFESL